MLRSFEEIAAVQAFGHNFKSYYLNSAKNWVFRYRIRARININGHIESMHRVIKHVCLMQEKLAVNCTEFVLQMEKY